MKPNFGCFSKVYAALVEHLVPKKKSFNFSSGICNCVYRDGILSTVEKLAIEDYVKLSAGLFLAYICSSRKVDFFCSSYSNSVERVSDIDGEEVSKLAICIPI